jgi:hypothetical protein
MNVNAFKSYTQYLNSPLEDADIAYSTTFIKSSAKQIVVGRKNVKMNHKLPGSEGLRTESAVLPV